MTRQKLVNGLKILLIIFLLTGIGALVIIQFKSDAIVRKAITIIQNQLQDSVVYEEVSLEWFRYFPSAALQINGLTVGNTDQPLIHGHVDVVLRIFPLLKEKIIINKLSFRDSHIHITKQKGRWSYEIFKKQEEEESIQKADVAAKNGSSKWNALIKEIEFENSTIVYDDKEGIAVSLAISEGNLNGNITGDLLDADLDIKATMTGLTTAAYSQSVSFPFELNGKYRHDMKTGIQNMAEWKITHEDIEIDLNGSIVKKENERWIDMQASWSDADPQFIKSIMPDRGIKDWDAYAIGGKSEGQIEIKGASSKASSPRIRFSSELKNGSIRFPNEGGVLKNILLDVAYDSGESKSKEVSSLRANLRNGSFEGDKLQADLLFKNLDNPVMDMHMKGAMPASILNLFMDARTWQFKNGTFHMEKYIIEGLAIKTLSTKTFIAKSHGEMKIQDLDLTYTTDHIKINECNMVLDESGKMKLRADEVFWNKAKGEDVKGELDFSADQVLFDITGKHSQGVVKSKGVLKGLGNLPVLDADWIVEGIEMKELLTSFENFDQTFITSEHLNGRADIWSHSTIPYDAKGNIRTKEIVLRGAIEIKDGKLKDLKTLEDFSKYVHIEDLQEIHFNAFRNYMKIENGKVFLPVMFIQSSAINMSINGVHSFNQDILYNIKVNAGQTASNKLKKKDPLKRFKPARKSGWINLYYVLSGNVDNVKYEQDQKQVISSFEQSSALKESLRNYLVDRFGHDVYWIEPNEWEDIPEYK